MGPCRGCRRGWNGAPTRGYPRTPSTGSSLGWAPSGSAAARSWTRTPRRRKKRWIRRWVRCLPRRSVLLAEDETDLLLFPPWRSCWAWRGQPADVRLCGWNARRVVFGAMNLQNGSRLFLVQERPQAEDFQVFLEVLPSSYRGWHVALLLDEDASHTAAESVELAEDYGMDLLWLPKRCPQLNPIDTLWGQGKDRMSANKQYATIDDQVSRFLDYLQSLSGTEALHTAGVLSKDFWLKEALLSKNFCDPA